MEKELSMEEIQEKLAEPFSSEEISWRILRSFNNGQKMGAFASAYVQSRAIMARLDKVLGVGNWENEYKELHSGIICGIRIHLPNGRSLVKWDGADLTDYEATKGGLSNAFKRAAVQWGIGRYLYEVPETYVEITSNKQVQDCNFIKDDKKNVKGYWVEPQLPSWAMPKGENKQEKNKGKKQENNQGKKQVHELSRGELNSYIIKMEFDIGLKPEQSVKVFNQATVSQIDGVNLLRNAEHKDLVDYYYALLPIFRLKKISKQYAIEEPEFLKLCQIKIPNVKINSLINLFLTVTDEQIKAIESLCKETYSQRQGQNQKVS